MPRTEMKLFYSGLKVEVRVKSYENFISTQKRRRFSQKLEMQIAANKDSGERNEIIKNLEKLEEYIHSNSLTKRISRPGGNITQFSDYDYACLCFRQKNKL